MNEINVSADFLKNARYLCRMEQTKEAKSWFETWFNTPYYHILYGERDFTEAEQFIQKISKHLPLPSDTSVLDLACGKGRHAVALRKYYNDVVGIDISENSITLAQEKTKDMSGIKFMVHDMRLPFYINYFNLVTNLFTSFGYFEKERDNFKSIRTVATSLKSGGYFVWDFLNANKVIKNLVASEVKELEGIHFDIERNFDGRFINKSIKFSDQGANYQFNEKVQAINEEMFKEYLNAANMEVVDAFGDYNLNPFASENSDRLIIVAQKK